MDSIYFDLLKLVYLFSMGVLVGGGFVLGVAAAPAIFASLSRRQEAGTVFGNVLARWDGLAILSVIAIVVSSALKAASFETVQLEVVLRWVALGVMSLSTIYASAWSNPIARSLRAQSAAWDDLPETSPLRREFAALHRRSRRAMSFAVLAGLVALYFS